MSEQTLFIILCLAVIAIPASAIKRSFDTTVVAIMVAFVTAVALAYRMIPTL